MYICISTCVQYMQSCTLHLLHTSSPCLLLPELQQPGSYTGLLPGELSCCVELACGGLFVVATLAAVAETANLLRGRVVLAGAHRNTIGWLPDSGRIATLVGRCRACLLAIVLVPGLLSYDALRDLSRLVVTSLRLTSLHVSNDAT